MEKLEAGHPDTQSEDIVRENLDRLRELFPEAFTEDKVDFDVLRELLGDAVDTGDEKYGLTWHGKRKARRLALTPSTGTLRPALEESVDWETTQNLMIEGDNLEVLKLLQKSYAGKVKLIYIDPPYNTGKDFVYPDDFGDNIRNYLELTGQVDGEGRKVSTNTDSGGRFHTNWLNMMYPRLKLARPLLTSQGVAFVSIDDREFPQLRQVMNEIYGEENFVGTIVWRTATDNNPTQIATDHEYLVCYAKDKNNLGFWEMPSDKARVIQEKYLELRSDLGNNPGDIQDALRAWIRSEVKSGDTDLDGVSHYSYVDDEGVYYPGNSANTRPGGYDFDIRHPVTGEVCAKPQNGFRWPRETFEEAAQQGNVHWGEDHTTVPKIKKRLETATELLKSSYYEDNRGSTQELASLMGAKVFDNPKSPRLLRRLIGFSTDNEDLILDIFAGSGTTAEAVVALNAEDGGSRRYLLVQLPEVLDASDTNQKAAVALCDQLGVPRTIAEVAKERLRRIPLKLAADGLEALPDPGFRVFKLDSSNIRPWDPQPEDLEATLFDNVDHLKDDRTEDDILFEVLLKLGLDLPVPIEERVIAGKRVHSIGGGVLFVCLATEVRADDAEALAMGIVDWRDELDPVGEVSVVFRDSGFENDVAKSNVAAILEQHGVDTVRSL